MMEIYLGKSRRLLQVYFGDASDIEKHFEGEKFRRRYRCSRGVTFSFEKSRKALSLYISFDLYKAVGVLYQIFIGQPVEELQLLWELGHLPFAKIYCSSVKLYDGRTVEIIDTVGFELQKVGDDILEATGFESDVSRHTRKMKLNRLKDAIPGTYSELPTEAAVSGLARPSRSEVIFADLVTDEEPRISAPSPPEERDPSQIAECDGCEQLFYESELMEIRPGLFLCQCCRIDPGVAQEFGLTPDELPGLCDESCDGCGDFMTEDELTEVKPGRWLCSNCILGESDD